MINKPLKNEVIDLMTCYKEHKIVKDKFCEQAKAMFYSVLEQQDISLDALSIYYIISSIVDNSDLSDDAFNKLINHLSDIISGECNYSHLMVIHLPKENVEFINEIRKIIRGIQEEQIISTYDREWLTNSFSSRLVNLTTLSDLLIERIARLLSMIDVNLLDCFNTDIVSTLHIASDVKFKEDLLNSICNYIDCLEGKRCVFISVIYSSSITVNII